MRKKYLGQQDFFSAQTKQGDSIVWRNIMKCRELIRQGLIWTVGDGKDILFWQDNWIENRNLLELLEIEDHDAVDLDLKVSEFIEDKHWNGHKLNLYLRNQDIVHKIFGIPIPISDIEDSFCWGLSITGIFTTNSATWLAHSKLKEEPHVVF